MPGPVILFTMIKAGNALVWTVSGLVFCQAVWAATPDSPSNANPYSGIVDRNVFGLKPPPPPAPPPEQPKPPVNITLTGITTLSGKKKCFITVLAAPKPGSPAAPESMMLSEGQRQGDIEIVSIDEKAGSVNLKQGESAETISFDKNGVKGGPPPPPAMAGGPGANPNPGLQPHPFTPTPGQKMIPGRPLRIPGANQTGGQASGEPTYSNGAIPSPAAGGQQQPQQFQPPISQEAGAVMIEAERLRLQDQGNPLANAMPITRLTPAGAPGTLSAEDSGSTQGQNQNSGSRSPSLPIPPGGPRPFRP